jgi:hypothetical protein
MMQPQPQLNRIQQMNNMMQNVRRDDGLSNLMALQQMRQMRQPQMMQQPPQTMTYMARGGFPDLSGDGQITQKDILMAKGVIERNQGGLTSLPVVAAFGGFNPFKPLRRAGKKITRGAQRLAGAAKDVVDSGLSGVKNALGGGSGTGDFLKTLALMAVTNMLLPGSMMTTSLGKGLLAAGKAYVVPSLATGGFNELTSDPLRTDKLLRAGTAGAGAYASDKFASAPESTIDTLESDIDFAAGDTSSTFTPKEIAASKAALDSGAPSTTGPFIGIDNPKFMASQQGPVSQFKANYVTPAIDATKQFASDVASYELPTIGAPYDVAQLGKDAVTAYGTTEIKKGMDAAKKAQQDARGLAAQIQREAEARKMTAQQFAKAAIEDPVKYSYVYKYGANPQSVQDILRRMYEGAEDTQTAQYFEPATYTTESGREPGELAAATGGGISSIINNARGQNNQFFQGQVPNTVDRKSDGMSDSETMLITDETGNKPKGIMKISEKEYVVSAPDMAILGNGDPNAGAQALDEFREGLRKAAYGTKAHQPRLNPKTALQSLANKAFG